MSAPVKPWRVTVTSWQAHSVIVQAASAAEAESDAERLWSDGDAGLFDHRDGGIDDIFAEEVLP